MSSLAAICEQRRSVRLAALRQADAAVVAAHPGGEVWLYSCGEAFGYGSLAQGNWDAIGAAGITPPYGHSLERFVEMLQTQGLNIQALTKLHLKPLTRMNSETRDPQGDEAPADLFDANDSQAALATAGAVVGIAAAKLTN